MENELVILGAGATGLAAGLATGATVFEAANYPGGICASYYLSRKSTKRSTIRADDENDYRFEIGGGHWVFGGDPKIINLFSKSCRIGIYERKSAIFFPNLSLYVPYPLQQNINLLPPEIKSIISKEQKHNTDKTDTLKKWLLNSFGEILCNLFFYPFHQNYTAGLYEYIAPQDNYKTPKILKNKKVTNKGYNNKFIYPSCGLGAFFQDLSTKTNVKYSYKVKKIDIIRKKIVFSNRETCQYEKIISTIPLKEMINICGLTIKSKPDPHTSVLVLNIGAKRGAKTPSFHWLYIPESNSGIHRIGFYSNVDEGFLPSSVRNKNTHVSIYAEKAFIGEDKPSAKQFNEYNKSIIAELQQWNFIEETEVVDPTWIDYAYTWKYPNSNWREEALSKLEQHKIYQAGRYGRWRFQGIADSIREGLEIGKKLSVSRK